MVYLGLKYRVECKKETVYRESSEARALQQIIRSKSGFTYGGADCIDVITSLLYNINNLLPPKIVTNINLCRS